MSTWQDRGINEAFRVLAEQEADGIASLRMVCDGMKYALRGRNPTWWAEYSRYTGPGRINQACRKILMRRLEGRK